MQLLSFIETDTRKMFAFKNKQTPYHLVAGTNRGDMEQLRIHIRKLGESKNQLASYLHSMKTSPDGYCSVDITTHDHSWCEYDEGEETSIYTLSLDDMYSNQFLIDTLIHSELNIFVMHELEITDQVRMKGVVLTGEVLKEFLSPELPLDEPGSIKTVDQYFDDIYRNDS
jgi:hypothetical protein